MHKCLYKIDYILWSIKDALNIILLVINIKDFSKEVKKFDWKVIAIFLLAIILRVVLLDARPPHHDEGINGWFADRMQAGGFYNYDPTNYHGPLHFYIVFLFQSLLGRDEWILRLPTVLISLLTIFWVFKYERFFGKTATYLAAFGMAISPGYVYYSRYAIHEADFLFFLILTFWGMLGLLFEGHKKYLWALGLGITGTIITKETYIIHIGCFVVAWLVLKVWEKMFASVEINIAKQEWSQSDIRRVLIVSVVIITTFYTGFFMDPDGMFGIFSTFKTWFNTGVEKGGHSKSFFYWFQLMWQYEIFALVGLIASIRYLFTKNKIMKFLSIYVLGILFVYSVISYKTPWCFVSVGWPFYFILGCTFTELLKSKARVFSIVIFLIIVINTIVVTCKLNFINYDNNRELYVYVHTNRDIYKLTEPVIKLAKENPVNYNLEGHIMRSSEWPLPWILGDFTMVGYLGSKHIPKNYNADFLIVERRRINEVEDKLTEKYFTDAVQMRSSQDESKIFLKYETFKSIFPGREPEFIPEEKVPLLPGQGLFASYFKNKECLGKPAFKKEIGDIDFYWEGDTRVLPPPFGVIFEGEVNIPSDRMKFILSSDDGGIVEINNREVIIDPGPHGIEDKAGYFVGMSGWNKIKVKYYDAGGGAVVKLKWVIDGLERVVPASAFRHKESAK